MFQQSSSLGFFSLLSPIRKPKIWFYLAYLGIRNEYRRTLLGPVWILLSLVIFAASMSVVYSGLFSIEYFDYLAYISTGMMAWTWVGALLMTSGMVYIQNGGILADHPVEKSYLIWSQVMNQFMVFLHQIPFMLLFYVFGGVPLNENTVYLIPSLMLMFLLNIGVAGALSIVVTRYRDLQKILSSLVVIVMVLTPIFWKPEMITGARALTYLLNPFYYMVEILRDPLLGRAPSLHSYSVAGAMTVIALVAGCVMHRRYSRVIIFRL
jgi:lipopolysaccharide transport system permease protein